MVNADGSGQQRLTRKAGADSTIRPGRRTAEDRLPRAGATGTDWNVFVMNADGSEQRSWRPPGHELGPGWSPDGQTIVFSAPPRHSASTTDVYVINAEGGGQRNLTHTPTTRSIPPGRPTGSRSLSP